ncbi:hypothetical protein HDU76_004417 [Blyttiomyces sp. JEL0837]|nr:hypothetical protein HDU76_004417 [Blyttiomyces sp. JEL0837]
MHELTEAAKKKHLQFLNFQRKNFEWYPIEGYEAPPECPEYLDLLIYELLSPEYRDALVDNLKEALQRFDRQLYIWFREVWEPWYNHLEDQLAWRERRESERTKKCQDGGEVISVNEGEDLKERPGERQQEPKRYEGYEHVDEEVWGRHSKTDSDHQRATLMDCDDSYTGRRRGLETSESRRERDGEDKMAVEVVIVEKQGAKRGREAGEDRDQEGYHSKTRKARREY